MNNFIKNILEYYPIYLLAHQNLWNRRLHVIGQIATIYYFYESLNLIYKNIFYLPILLFLPFIVYPFAWTGHLYFEKNKPATWHVNPVYTKICDWIMFKDILIGRISILR